MSNKKIAEVRINDHYGIVQIKMNKGPNHTLEGDEATRFISMRDAYIMDNNSKTEANMLAANDYISGRMQHAV